MREADDSSEVGAAGPGEGSPTGKAGPGDADPGPSAGAERPPASSPGSAPEGPETVEDVLDELDRIVQRTVREDSMQCVFAFVYRRTTEKIGEGIETGRFRDPGRMEDFDVVFARRYLDAFWRNREGKPTADAWKVAFDATDEDLILLQHLLLGMSAHINLDLGIAAAQVAPGSRIASLEDDFMTVNHLLAELVDEMQDRIARASPLTFLLDWIGHRDDEAVINFSIGRARGFAWDLARRLAGASDADRERMIDAADRRIARLGRLVARPPGFLAPRVLRLVRLFEPRDAERVLQAISA